MVISGAHSDHRYNAEGIGQDITAYCVAYPHGKGQKKGSGHGAGSDPARVKGDGRKDLRHEKVSAIAKPYPGTSSHQMEKPYRMRAMDSPKAAATPGKAPPAACSWKWCRR